MIVDSSVWIDYLNGVTNLETQWLDFRVDRERIGLTTIILTEVLQGLRDDREAAAVQAELMHFEVIELHEITLAIDAARHYRHLRSLGRTVRKTADLLIATYCIREQHALLHRDVDFDPFAEHLGLDVIIP